MLDRQHRPDLATPPVAKKVPVSTTHHGVTLVDDYAWLRDGQYPQVEDETVLDYLKAENSYFENFMAPHQALADALFAELKGRIKEDDASVPYKKGDWLYSWRFDIGEQYRRWYRQPVAGGEPAVILDEPALAEGLEFFRLGGMAVSPDASKLAWSVDDDGSERFTMRIKDLHTGQVFDESIGNTLGSPVWAADNTTLFYLEVNDQWRPFRAKAHRLGTAVEADRIVYEEADSSFFVGLGMTQSDAYILLSTGDHVTNEVRVLPADQPDAEPTLIAARNPQHEYHVEHVGDTLYILTNDLHKNFRLVQTALHTPGRDHWEEVIAGSDRHYLQGLTTFADFFVLEERVDGLDQIRLRTYDGDEHTIAFPEQAYAAGLGANAEFAMDVIRVGYESMVTPGTVYDYHVAERRLETLKVQEIPSGYDASLYATERLMAPALDGAQIPVSVVYRKDTPRDSSAPVHLYGYGAYGAGMSPAFSTARLSLLDRGFIYVIAHIRGGDEMGYHWYEAGKLFNRTNTFNDFIDVAEYLIAQGYAAAGDISISGGSAGGELMGAVANMRPELWRAVVAHVPFVDVLNTMLDETLPLTPIEWPEWGNPIADKQAFDYIHSYSPYENVSAQAYPPILVTAGLNDPRVTYWEPAKWVAKLRAVKTDEHLLVFKINMGAGHAGKSGRFDSLTEVAEEYVFLLAAFGRAV